MKVHERRAEERNQLELLQAELQGIQVLSDEEEGNLQNALKDKRSLEAELEGRVEGLRKAALWLDRVAALEREITELDRLLLDFAERRRGLCAGIDPVGEIPQGSRSGRRLPGVAALRIQQVNETGELAGAAATLPGKEKACADTLNLKQAAEAGLTEARTRQVAEAEVLKKVRELDARLGEQKKQVEEKVKAIGDVERQGRSLQATSNISNGR